MATAKSDAQHAELKNIPLGQIDRNPDNPRLVFRAGELEQLLESIREYGVQVPISVYREGRRFVLIDGERRWRCCMKLNSSTIPALVQEKPSPLSNLLLMFNIHALREQWDLMTIALKLPSVRELLAAALGQPPNEKQLAERTGLPIGVLRRCKTLAELPQKYKDQLLDELKKPKAQQRLSEDFFIEMERALVTVENRMPEVIPSKEKIRKVLIDKYKSSVIGNVVQFRLLGKIAGAEKVAADTTNAREVLTRVFEKNVYSIANAYEDSVSGAYAERDVLSRIDRLVDRLDSFPAAEVDDELRNRLRTLIKSAKHLLGNS